MQGQCWVSKNFLAWIPNYGKVQKYTLAIMIKIGHWFIEVATLQMKSVDSLYLLKIFLVYLFLQDIPARRNEGTHSDRIEQIN